MNTNNNLEEKLLEHGIVGGKSTQDLLQMAPTKNLKTYFFSVTEKRSESDIDLLVNALEVVK